MAKVKSHRPHKFNASTKRNLFIVAAVLTCLGLLAFFMEYKNHKLAEMQSYEASEQAVVRNDPSDIGPDHGCTLDGSNYVCDIKINNPSQKPLEWWAVLDGLDGATVSDDGAGTIAAGESKTVQLSVPAEFCNPDPNRQGTVTIMDSKRSSNQSEAEFDCQPEEM